MKERRSKYWDRRGGEEDNKGGAKEWSHHQHQKQYAQPQTVEKKDSVANILHKIQEKEI